jgi:hypothetical protein
MNPDGIIVDFQRAVDLFRQFRMIQQPQRASTIDLVVEAQIRLEQALYLLRVFRQHEREHHEKRRALEATSNEQLLIFWQRKSTN